MKATKQDSVQSTPAAPNLGACIEQSVTGYFDDMDGHEVSDLYNIVISEVEKSLFKVVLKNYKGNLSHSAQALGLNRKTVSGRLKKYGLDR